MFRNSLTRLKAAPAVPYAPAFLLGIICIFLSYDFAFYNQGDFAKVTGIFFGPSDIGPERGSVLFPLGGKGLHNLEDFTSSLFVFGFGALSQWPFHDHFDIRVLGNFAKIIVAVSAILLGFALSQTLQLPKAVGGALAAFAVLLFFLPHNSALFNTLYTEYALFMALPLLVALLILRMDGWLYALGIAFLAAMAGAAKTQFFYTPLLVTACLLLNWFFGGCRPAKKVLLMLLVAQAVAAVPMTSNKFQQLNYYHSMYFGSYMAASDETLAKIGLTEQDRACVGVDAFGNAYRGLADDTFEPGHDTCFADRTLSLHDVLRPYLLEPSIFFKMMVAALPVHGSVAYFHVDRSLPYLYSLDDNGSLSNALAKADSVREAVPAWASAAICVLVCLIATSLFPATTSAALFLSLFVFSQVVVCLLGEGVRDLSRHLSGAQYAVDMLLVMLASQCAAWVLKRRT